MLKLITTLALILCVNFVFGQKLKKKVDLKGIFKEVYYINKKTDLKHGKSFVVNSENKDTLCVGEFKNGIRTGVWNFGDRKTGSWLIKYDFTEDRLLKLNKELLPDSFLVKIDGNYEIREVDRPLTYIGYNDEIRIVLAQNIFVPEQVIKEKKSGVSILGFYFDKKGSMIGTKVISGDFPKLAEQVNSIISRLPGKFLPAICNGEPVESSFFVRVNVGLPPELFNSEQEISYIKHIDLSYHTITKVGRQTKRIGTVRVESVRNSHGNRIH